METPAVSVILALYRPNAWLDEALDSLTRQGVEDVEVIAVDDGSPDDPAPRIAAWRDRLAIRCERLAENGGIFAARRHGVHRARGDWVMFLDQDDRLAPEALQTAMQAAGDHRLDIARLARCPTDAAGVPLEADRGTGEDGDILIAEGTDCTRLFFDRTSRSVTGTLYRRHLLERAVELMPATERINHAEDWIYNAVATHEAQRIGLIPRRLYLYRHHENSLTKGRDMDRALARLAETGRVVDKLLALFARIDPDGSANPAIRARLLRGIGSLTAMTYRRLSEEADDPAALRETIANSQSDAVGAALFGAEKLAAMQKINANLRARLDRQQARIDRLTDEVGALKSKAPGNDDA